MCSSLRLQGGPHRLLLSIRHLCNDLCQTSLVLLKQLHGCARVISSASMHSSLHNKVAIEAFTVQYQHMITASYVKSRGTRAVMVCAQCECSCR